MRAQLVNLVRDPRLHLRLQFGSALGLGVGLILSAAIISGITPTRLSDFLYQPPPPTNQVVLIVIDDPSLKEIGALPWSHSTLAALIEAISAAQPRVIGLDLILPEATADDDQLARTLNRTPNVILPLVGIEVTRYPALADTFPRFDVAFVPAPFLPNAPARLAHTMVTPDSDGIVRRVPLAIHVGAQQYSALGIAALERYDQRVLDPQIVNGRVGFGARSLPVDEQGQLKVNFVAPSALPTLAAADILRRRANLAGLRDKIVLVGVTGSTTPGNYRLPIANNHRAYPVEIQAHLIETVLGEHLLLEQDRLTEIVMIFLLAILAGVTLLHFRLLSAMALMIIYLLLYLGYAFQMFNSGVIVQPLYPLAALGLVFVGAMTFRYFSVERRRAATLRLLRRYVAPDAVERVADDFTQGALPLTGNVRHVSVLCVDLGDLTQRRTVAPTQLIHLLNQYTMLVAAVVFRHGGSITQQTGETIVAMWNLLLEQAEHGQAAVDAALEIKHEIAEWESKPDAPAPLKVGIGVTTGDVVAGRIGAAARVEYVIVGEALTIAQRLAAKPERGLFVDSETFARVGARVDTRQVKPIKLRRKTDPAQVWQIVLPVELDEAAADGETTGEPANATNE